MWRAPSTIYMPPPTSARRDVTRGGFARGLTKEDLALDPESAVMNGNAHDNIAAAIVDAEEAMKAEREDERQSAASNAVGRERRAFWDLGASYEHPADMPRDASVGARAFQSDNEDNEDQEKQGKQGKQGGAGSALLPCPFCEFATTSGPMYAAHVRQHVTTSVPQTRLNPPVRVSDTAQGAQRMTTPNDDEATHFSTSFYAPGHALTLVSAARAASVLSRKGHGHASAGAMRTSKPVIGEALMFDQPRTGSADAMAFETSHAQAHAVRAVRNAATSNSMGFRFRDRDAGRDAPARHASHQFYPAQGSMDRILYEAAASIAPDVGADVADFAALRGFDPDRMIEPLDARFAMMCEIEKDATHTRDPYMVPRTGPSVLHAGNARPPSWYVRPG